MPDSNVNQAVSTPLRRNINFWLICAVVLFTLITVSGNQITLIPILGYERLGLTTGQVGLALTLVAVMQLIMVPFAGRLSDKLGRKKLIVPGGIVTVLGLLLFTRANYYFLFLTSSAILGMGRGLCGPVPTAYVADTASSED